MEFTNGVEATMSKKLTVSIINSVSRGSFFRSFSTRCHWILWWERSELKRITESRRNRSIISWKHTKAFQQGRLIKSFFSLRFFLIAPCESLEVGATCWPSLIFFTLNFTDWCCYLKWLSLSIAAKYQSTMLKANLNSILDWKQFKLKSKFRCIHLGGAA